MSPNLGKIIEITKRTNLVWLRAWPKIISITLLSCIVRTVLTNNLSVNVCNAPIVYEQLSVWKVSPFEPVNSVTNRKTATNSKQLTMTHHRSHFNVEADTFLHLNKSVDPKWLYIIIQVLFSKMTFKLCDMFRAFRSYDISYLSHPSFFLFCFSFFLCNIFTSAANKYGIDARLPCIWYWLCCLNAIYLEWMRRLRLMLYRHNK